MFRDGIFDVFRGGLAGLLILMSESAALARRPGVCPELFLDLLAFRVELRQFIGVARSLSFRALLANLVEPLLYVRHGLRP